MSQDVERLFAVCDVDEADAFWFFLVTGGREQDVANARYSDLDCDGNRFLIRAKDDWTPKDREESEVPVPSHFIERMKARHARYHAADDELIFPNRNGDPQVHFLRTLQDIATRHHLKGEWGLHKFRKTFATLHHANGVPARVIQRWLRHSSLATTQRYLDGDDEAHRSKVESTFAAVA